MPERTNYWKIGLFVIAGAVVGLTAIVWISAARLARETIDAYAYFNEPVSGLEVGSSVKFRGVSIGKVAEIATAPDRRHVEVRADLFTDSLQRLGLLDGRPGDGQFAPSDLRVQLVSSALTGITYVQSDFFDVKKYPVPSYGFDVPPNTIHSVTSTFKTLEEGLLTTLYSLPPLVEEATSLMKRIDQGIDELQPAELSKRAQALLAELAAADGPVHRVADRFDALIRRFEDELDRARLDQTLAEVRRASGTFADASGEVGELGRDLRGELAHLGDTLAAIRRLADLLERDPGALIHGKTPARPVRREGR